MTKKALMMYFTALTMAMLFYAAMLSFPAWVAAKPKVVDLEGMSYDVNASMADNLKTLTGKRAYVTLDGGKVFSGKIKEVGNHFLHLEKLDGKDYFDALIRIEDISAIDARFRDIQR